MMFQISKGYLVTYQLNVTSGIAAHLGVKLTALVGEFVVVLVLEWKQHILHAKEILS